MPSSTRARCCALLALTLAANTFAADQASEDAPEFELPAATL